MLFKTLLSLLLAVTALAWSDKDTEIFQLQSLLHKHSPESESFYDLLSIPQSSNSKDISKRFKRLSVMHHPDKIGAANQTNNEFFEFLQLASSVLRDGDKRKTYDYYLRKGFPEYTGTNWTFNTFKPGVLFVIGLLAVIVNVFHYVILWISYRGNVGKIERLIKEVKALDKNPSDFKEKRVFHPMLNKEFLIRVDGIFLVEKEGNWDNFREKFVRVDVNEVDVPNWRDSLFVKSFVGGWNYTLGRWSVLELQLVRPARIVEEKKDETEEQQKKKKKKVAKRLPNGKIVYRTKED